MQRLPKKQLLDIVKRQTEESLKGFSLGHQPWNKGLTNTTDERWRKRNEARIGHPVSTKTRRKLSRSLIGRFKGEKNPRYGKCGEGTSNWKGGTSFEPYPIKFTRQLKELIRLRDNYQCQKCGCSERENMRHLSVHHIDYDKNNCLPSNLTSLCKRCNTEVNSGREFWKNLFRKKLAERGLL